MDKPVLNLYICHQCFRECMKYIWESPDVSDGEIIGYDDLNDCEYVYQLDSVVKESD